MYLVAFEALMGQGKTSGMTLLLDAIAKQSNATIFSNYGMKGSLPFYSFEDFYVLAQQPSSVVGYDEAYIDLDSRSGNSNHVKYFTEVVYYFRKLRTTFFFTTPDLDNLDSRVRKMLNLYVFARKTKKYFFYDFYNAQTMRYMYTRSIPRFYASILLRDLFDTDKMVRRMKFPSVQAEFDEFLANLDSVNEEYRKQNNIRSA